MVAKTRANGIEVIVLESKPNTPDAVFPINTSNKITSHILLYIQCIHKIAETKSKFTTTNYKVIDFCGDCSKALEGTGVFIFDNDYKL